MGVALVPDRRRVILRRSATLLGFLVGVWCTSILMAVTSHECNGMRRSLTLLPPGLRCSGPKDDYRVPWGTEGPGAVPGVLLGGAIGALVVALLIRVLSQRSEPRG